MVLLESVTARMAANAETIRTLVQPLTDEQATWRPAPEQWSVLEVVNHLLDEEQDDFRLRLDLTLHHPEKAWPGIDPKAAVRDRSYNERDPAESLQRFLEARDLSLSWLRTLKAPDWNRAHAHPKLGEIQAGELLASWLGHDYLHIRQIANLTFEYTAILAAPFSTRYAKP